MKQAIIQAGQLLANARSLLLRQSEGGHKHRVGTSPSLPALLASPSGACSRSSSSGTSSSPSGTLACIAGPGRNAVARAELARQAEPVSWQGAFALGVSLKYSRDLWSEVGR